jgi:Zn-dependent M28 family amino/carboxypeptidase
MKIKSSALLLALGIVAICSLLAAQQTKSTAAVTIAVKDESGAVVPHAQIELSPSPATTPQNLETGENGALPLNLTPGDYNLYVTVPGFKRWSQHIQVQGVAAQTISVVLKVGPCPPGSCTPVYVGGPTTLLRIDQTHLGSDSQIDQTFAHPYRLNAVAIPAAVQTSHFDGQTWWNHIKFLADDKLEGRDTGSRGEREAQKYAVEQLERAGAESAGVNGFYQPVKFVSRQIVEKDCSLTLIRDVEGKTKREPLTLGEDAIISTRVMPAPEVEAPLVFAGYGLKVPEKNYDDFAGVDVRGKIIVILAGSPSEIPGALASHYQTAAERWKVLRADGAVSLINPASMDIPWSRMALNRAHPSMDLDYPEFNETEGAKIAVTVNPASAEKFFAGSGHTFEEIAALGKDRKPLPHFPLAVSLAAKTKVDVTKIESANLVAKLPGSDPALKDEYVVLSAHLDHIGIGEPINGDRIYNGAMDNGSGSALVLDMAASFKKNPEKLRRSILLVLVTGEEKGLLGSKYFAAHPTVPPKSIVADVNVDMFLPIVPLRLLTVLGLDDSDLGDRVREIAQSFGVTVQPDPEPLRNLFVRSDQYNFIRHGVPSVIMSVAPEPGTPEVKIFKDWLTQRYHAPSDDVDQPVDLAAAAKYEEIVRALVISVANGDHRPQWKPDSFFRRYAEPVNIGQ